MSDKNTNFLAKEGAGCARVIYFFAFALFALFFIGLAIEFFKAL